MVTLALTQEIFTDRAIGKEERKRRIKLSRKKVGTKWLQPITKLLFEWEINIALQEHHFGLSLDDSFNMDLRLLRQGFLRHMVQQGGVEHQLG